MSTKTGEVTPPEICACEAVPSGFSVRQLSFFLEEGGTQIPLISVHFGSQPHICFIFSSQYERWCSFYFPSTHHSHTHTHTADVYL